MTYDTKNAYLSYDDTFYSLKISGKIIPPTIENFDEDFKPMLIIKTEEKTQVFPVQSIEEGTTLQLRGILPSSFLDRPITIVGIVPQKNTYVNSSISTNRAIDFYNNVSLGEDLSSTNENSTENSNTSENSNENNEQNNQEENNEENETNPDIKQIYWLPASDIKIRGFSNNTIKIPSSAQNDGIDYSRKLK